MNEKEYKDTHTIHYKSENKQGKCEYNDEWNNYSISQSVSSTSTISSYDQFKNRFQKFKESYDSEFKSTNLAILKRIVEVFIITFFICTIVFLFLFIKNMNNNESDISGLILLYQRMIHLGNLYLTINLLNSINKTENSPIFINNIDYFTNRIVK